MTLSVVIITYNEEANLGRTLESVKPLVSNGRGEIIVVDSGSTDRTIEIAKSYGAKVFVEDWKGFAAQKNSAIDKAGGAWILSLDADEEVEAALGVEIGNLIAPPRLQQNQITSLERLRVYTSSSKVRRQLQTISRQPDTPESFFVAVAGCWVPRKNSFLGRWVKHGGFWPDLKLRLFRKGAARFENRLVHEDVKLVGGLTLTLQNALLHHSYPTLSGYIEHMNRYSSLGAEMANVSRPRSFSVLDIVVRPWATFVYNYFFRLGFLDGREGLLLHLYHAVYVSWKYAKAWEMGRTKKRPA